jgi:hypothetical protein
MAFSCEKRKNMAAKVHYLNPLTGKSFCRRSSSTWLDENEIKSGANTSSDPLKVNCVFCLRAKNQWPILAERAKPEGKEAGK